MTKKFRIKNIFSYLGPGLITASVVIGPGSISTNSWIGANYGCRLVWMLVVAIISMAVYTLMASRFGIISKKSILTVVSEKYGRWLAILVGISSYFMTISFEFGNNLGAATATESLTGFGANLWPFVFSGTALIIIFTSPDLYKVLERIMMVLVAVMITAFTANLLFTNPSGMKVAAGIVPSLPKGSLTAAAGLAGTTFCINAAFYQAYLVQDKGWTLDNYKKCVSDSIAGVFVLGIISLLIMVTAASSLYPHGIQVTSAGDMAVQLEILFGRSAKFIFCIGLWAASFSSIVVTSFLGGGMLSDSLGWGGSTRNIRTKVLASVSILIGMTAAVFFRGNFVDAIVFAQALTLLAFPVFAVVLILLSNNKEIMGVYRNTWYENILAGMGVCLLTWMMVNTYLVVIEKISN
ncbi:Nramp family divalent metal transporter [Candidatus Latescibacterota bacterium]